MHKPYFFTAMLVLFIATATVCHAQHLPLSICKRPVNWAEWEIDLPDSTRLQIVEKLAKNIQIEYGLKYYSYSTANILHNYHFLDYNRDGQLDIVYNGFAGVSNHGIVFFENRDGKYVKTMSFYGDIVEVFQTDVWAPLAFKIWNYRQCGNYVNFLETYVPVKTNAMRAKYTTSDRLAFVQGTEIPKQFHSPVPFKIIEEDAPMMAKPIPSSEDYRFKYTQVPTVDPEPQNQFFEHEGNIIARFKEESGGFVLAEKENDQGKWYFVALSTDPGMKTSAFCSKGDNNSYRYAVIGWIHSKHLQVIEVRQKIIEAPLIFFGF